MKEKKSSTIFFDAQAQISNPGPANPVSAHTFSRIARILRSATLPIILLGEASTGPDALVRIYIEQPPQNGKLEACAGLRTSSVTQVESETLVSSVTSTASGCLEIVPRLPPRSIEGIVREGALLAELTEPAVGTTADVPILCECSCRPYWFC